MTSNSIYKSWWCSKCSGYRETAKSWQYSKLYRELTLWVFNSAASKDLYIKYGGGCQGCVRMCEHKTMRLAMLLAKLGVKV